MKNKIPILLGLMVAIGAIVAGFILIPVNRSLSTSDKVKQIEKLIQEKNYNAAMEAAEQWLGQDRQSTNAHWLRGQALEGMGRNSEALSVYQSCPLVEGDSASARCKLRCSEFYFQQGNATEVERYLKLALKAQDDMVEANYQLYLILTLQARRWEGEPYLLKLATLRETDLEDLVLLTLSSLYISDPKGRELFPLTISGNERFRLIDARLAFDRNSLTEAETILRGILKQNPDLPDARAWLGWTLLQQRNREALAVWNQSLPQRATEHPLCWLTRGMWYLQQDQDKLAARCFAEVLHRDSINSSATYQLAILLNRFGEAEKAEKMSRRSLALHELEQLTHKLYTRKDQPELYTALKERIDTIPKSMEAIGRYIEAAAWQHWICGKNPGDANCLAELERLKTLAAKAQEKTIAELSPLSGVDFKKWPLPDGATMQSAASSGSDMASTSASGATKWRNVAQDVGISFIFANDRDPKIEGIPINKATGGGVGVLDYDRDGWPDLYWTQGGSIADGKQVELKSDTLYRNLQGQQFQEIAAKAFVTDGQFGAGLAVGDFDCDGFPDLYIANQEQNRLWRNNGDGTFDDVTESAKIVSPIWTTSALMVDINGDTFPDLFDVTYVEGNDYKVKLCVTDGPPRGCGPTAFTPSQDRLWINQGDGSFVEQSKEAGVHAPGGYGLGTVGADFSKSSRLDLFVANDESANFYFRNKFKALDKSTTSPNREAGFVERAVLEGVAFDRDGVAQACMGIAVDDADGDGLLDLFITNFYNQANILYLQKSNGFIDATNPSGIRTPSYRMLGFGTQFVDADLDGNPDLVVTNGHVDDYTYKNVPFKMPAQFFRNQGKGRFVEEKAITLGPFFNERYLGRGLATCDWNRDGREDILISHVDAPAALLQNETTEVGNYISIEVVGTQSPRDGYGTTIEVEANGKKRTRQLVAGGGYQAVNEQKLILGIGRSEKIDRLKIRWLSGTELEMKDVPLNSEWLAVEGTGSLQRQK